MLFYARKEFYMDRARIVLFEDLSHQRDMVHEVFEGTGHDIVAVGTTLDESLAIVEDLAAGTVEADVVILDGNLTKGTVPNGDDAREIKAAIDRHNLPVRLIGFSAVRDMQSHYGITLDADSGKNPHALPGLVDML
jgi:CheY-like chemotaxis protein